MSGLSLGFSSDALSNPYLDEVFANLPLRRLARINGSCVIVLPLAHPITVGWRESEMWILRCITG